MVEDEKGLADGLKTLLEKEGFSVDVIYDGISGLDYALSNIYDLIILDIMLPKLNGLEILREIRRQKIEVPVLMLTAKSEMEDIIKGLDCGADDYLTKPFNSGEFLARVRAHTRRKIEYVDTSLVFGDIRLNRNTLELCRGNSSIKLGSKEFQLMECLIINSRRIVPRDMLCEKVWGPEDITEYNNVEVYISFLRKKLLHLHSDVQIRATRNVGYSIEEG